jgi:quinol monooxygenase YgiN
VNRARPAAWVFPYGKGVVRIFPMPAPALIWPSPTGGKVVVMVKVGLYVRLEAKRGKENELAQFLKAGQALAQEERDTTVWYALRFGPSTFGIFDAFEAESGREAHLKGQIATALMTKAPDLLAEPPRIEKVDVLASK